MRVEKYCKRCDQTLPIERFTKSAGRYDGVQAYCSDCMKLYRIEHYRRDKQAHYDRNKKTEAKLRQYVLEVKSSGNCADCGVTYPEEPWLLEFDHLPGFDKVNTISRLVTYGSQIAIEKEISKCELVCLICHRRRTARRGGWLDNRLAHLL